MHELEMCELGKIFLLVIVIACISTVFIGISLKPETIKIESLKTDTNMHGDFFLGSGTVESESYYWFYKINKDGSKELDKIPTEGTKIYEDATEPYIVKKSESYVDAAYELHMEYELHVPKGAVIGEFITENQTSKISEESN